MTTEIAILNRQGIALAADSAVTIGQQRVWKTANKLFSLSPHNDMAIMAYGSGDFVSFPWETIVKCFRHKVGPRQFATVNECAEEFIRYLEGDTFQNAGSEIVSILLLFKTHLERLKERVGEHKQIAGYKSKKEFRQKLCDQVSMAMQRLRNNRAIFLNTATLKDFRNTYEQLILDVAKDIFKEVITHRILKALSEFCFEVYRRGWASDYETGVVVAGFGKNEFFPAVVAYMVDGKHNKTLRAWRADNYCHDINDPDQSEGVIIPFGQSDVAYLFLDGIVQRHLRWLNRSLRLLLDAKSRSLIDKFVGDQAQKTTETSNQRTDNQAVLRKFEDEFKDYRDKNLVQPIMKVVTTLPKEEMAAMAQALVELTSLRRKVDSPLESVGGPTDVAVISKGDGLIWIKRKPYFDLALNKDFEHRKAMHAQGAAP
jgi:hypothetical protein